MRQKTGKNRICKICQKEFYSAFSRLKRAKYCSRKCYYIGRPNNIAVIQLTIGRANSKKIRIAWNKGKKGIYKWSEKSKKKLSITLKKLGHHPPSQKGRRLSEITKKKLSIAHKKLWTAEKRKELSEARRGAKSSNWKGGITPQNKLLRHSSNYKNWRKQIFEKDNYTCQHCYKRGGKLHPHHIKQFAFFPLLRFDIKNGITLCEKCHKQQKHFNKFNLVKKDKKDDAFCFN